MSEKFIRWISKLQALLLPYTCFLCRQRSDQHQDLCTPCRQDLPIVSHKCPRCAQKIDFIDAQLLNKTPLCGACLKDPPAFIQTFSLFSYEPPINWLLLALKFKANLVVARILGELLSEKIMQATPKSALPHVIIPVPLHPSRLKERGFNQALELARPLAKKLKLPIDYTSAKRIINSPPQMRLSSSERHSNIKNAFYIQGDWSGKHIAILDDVMTTGATVAELSLAFLKKGAKTVTIWCIARA